MDKTKHEYNFTIFSKEIIDKQFELLQRELNPSMDYRLLLKKFHKILHNRVVATVVDEPVKVNHVRRMKVSIAN